MKSEKRRYLMGWEPERARKALRKYLEHYQDSPMRDEMQRLLGRLAGGARVVNEAEQALIRIAEEDA